MGGKLSTLSSSTPSLTPLLESLELDSTKSKCIVDVFWDVNSAPCDVVAPHMVLAGLKGVAAAFGGCRQCYVFAHAPSIPDSLKEDMKTLAASAQVRLVPTGQVRDVLGIEPFCLAVSAAPRRVTPPPWMHCALDMGFHVRYGVSSACGRWLRRQSSDCGCGFKRVAAGFPALQNRRRWAHPPHRTVCCHRLRLHQLDGRFEVGIRRRGDIHGRVKTVVCDVSRPNVGCTRSCDC
jgi:hypothetical protein